MHRDHRAASTGLQDLLARACGAPWQFGFISFLRRYSAADPSQPAWGFAKLPRHETLRLGQTAALSFAPREVASLALAQAAEDPPGASANRARLPILRVFGLGLLGPNGPLPIHCTELVRERTEHHHDSTLADFLDLFHHRYLTLMYRAWAQAQAAAGLDRADEETFSPYLAHLTGHDPQEIRGGVLPAHARLASAAYLSSESRHPDGLAATLAHYFAVPVRIEEFVHHWIRIEREDETRLGEPNASSLLGLGAVAGEYVADRQSRFKLVLGPMDISRYLGFTPQGCDLHVLVECVRSFVGLEFEWETELQVRNDSAPAARLGASERLGWSTWLCGAGEAAQTGKDHPNRTPGHVIGMVFEPENYLAAQATPAACTA